MVHGHGATANFVQKIEKILFGSSFFFQIPDIVDLISASRIDANISFTLLRLSLLVTSSIDEWWWMKTGWGGVLLLNTIGRAYIRFRKQKAIRISLYYD